MEMNEEFRKLRKEVYFLLIDERIPDIKSEIEKNNAARAIIGTDNYICTVSIVKKPSNPNTEIRLFEELDKLAGVMKKWN